MPYSDLFSNYIEGMPKGYADNSSTFGEVNSANIDSAIADTSFFRDIANNSRFTDRNNFFKENGVDFLEQAKKNVSQPEPSVIGLFDNSSEEYAKKTEEESHRLADEVILAKRQSEPNSPIAYQKTTQEIRELTVAARQAANLDAAKVTERAGGWFSKYGGQLTGAAIGTMTDPINALTLPLGASAGVGIIRGALIDGAINMGIEAFQTPENMKWAKEAGVQYGFGDAAFNIATAGVGAGVISGTVRGAGKLLTKGKSLEVLDKIAEDATLPSEVRDAARYQATVSHIDDNMPTDKLVATDEEIAINRSNLQEVQDAISEGREPVIDDSIFPDRFAAKEADLAVQGTKAGIQNRIDGNTKLAEEAYARGDKKKGDRYSREVEEQKARLNKLEAQNQLSPILDALDDAYLDEVRAFAKGETKPVGRAPVKYPVLNMIRKMGGISPDSPLIGELRTMGINKKQLGFLTKKDGRGDIDNLPASEWKLSDTPVQRDGYVDRAYILESIKAEIDGNPIRMADAPSAKSDIETYYEQLDRAGIDIANMTNAEVKAAIAAEEAAMKADAAPSQIDPSVPDRVREPIEFIENRVNRITDEASNNIALADLDKYMADAPEFQIHMDDGSVKSLSELSQLLKEDSDIMQSLTTCGLGK